MPSDLNTYISSFNEKLKSVAVNKLLIDRYPADYLQFLISNSRYYLEIYVHVLERLLENIDKKKEEIVLVDYGAGNGLLGMFAKHVGFKKVYLNDHSPAFLVASKQLATALNIHIDEFVEGDCDALVDCCKHTATPDAVVGTDVIEHIYSLENFFSCISLLNKKMVTVFTTASVTTNPFKSKQLKQLQYNDEFVGSNAAHAKPGDEFAGLPFIEIRKRILRKEFCDISDTAVENLAIATRGMNKDDIIKAGIQFLKDGSLPKPPSHPTNTCDPVTGSWTERLLTLNEYKNIYQEAGFDVRCYNGFYNQWQAGLKGFLLKMTNILMLLFKGFGQRFTPFITLVGR